jgi:hypothetical protein
MTTSATTQTPYRTNAAVPSHGRLAFSQHAIRLLIACAVVLFFATLWLATNRRAQRRIDVVHAMDEAKRLQLEAVDWRSVHPVSCPTLGDLGVPATHADPWNMAYAIECTTTTTTVRSAGPDRTYFTADDPRYPDRIYDDPEAP